MVVNKLHKSCLAYHVAPMQYWIDERTTRADAVICFTTSFESTVEFKFVIAPATSHILILTCYGLKNGIIFNMSSGENKQPTPRVVKGTGYYTPMDVAPGEKPSKGSTLSSPVPEMTGLPTAMDSEPSSSDTPQESSEQTQTSNGGNDAKND